MNSTTSLLKNFFNFSFSPLRSAKQYPGGIKYPGFVYYPRTENFKDPPYEPSKLFLVKRYKNVKGTIPQERKALEELNIDGKKMLNCHITIVKNTPRTNALLWKVKHLVIIKPITWKGELPKDGDCSGTYLRETGELLISPRLKLTESEQEATEKYLGTKKLDKNYFKSYLRKKWNDGLSDVF